MLGNLIINILAVSRELVAGQVVNNQLNPRLLSVATTGYRVQSHTLQIPDRFGVFSSGPPRLQVHQAFDFIVLVTWTCLNLIFATFLVFLGILYGRPTCRNLGAAYVLIMIAEAFFLWFVSLHDRHRVPGYEWKDWKLRMD